MCLPAVTIRPALHGFFLQQRFHYAPLSQNLQQGGQGLPAHWMSLSMQMSPILEDAMWSNHCAFQPRCGVVECCLRVPAAQEEAVVPAQLPHCFSYLLPLFSLFSFLRWCCLVAAGLDRRQECFGVTMPFGSLQGATLGSAGGWRRWVSVCLTPVLTLSCVCRDWSMLLCTHTYIAPDALKVVCSGKVQAGFFFASTAVPCL